MTRSEKRMTIVSGAIIIVMFISCGIGSALYFGDDNPIEEAAEVVIETQAEEIMGLPDGSLQSLVDVTPKTKENK